MNAFLNLTVGQLRRAADLKEKIDNLNSELSQILGGEIPVPFYKKPGGGGMSAEGRKRIGDAARARWAKFNAAKGKSNGEVKKKRTMSASARRKIAAAQRARWAKVRVGNKPF
jgi:hypothetical protein